MQLRYDETSLSNKYLTTSALDKTFNFYITGLSAPDDIYTEFQKINPNKSANIVEITRQIIFLLDKESKENYHNVITPWTIELAKERAGLVGILGEIKIRLPIVVKIYNNRYEHKLTQDLLFGILLVCKNIEEISFYALIERYDNLLVQYEDIAADYINDGKIKRRFVADTPHMEITFNTIDVIIGVITGCKWLNRNSHKYISNITEEGVLLRF